MMSSHICHFVHVLLHPSVPLGGLAGSQGICILHLDSYGCLSRVTISSLKGVDSFLKLSLQMAKLLSRKMLPVSTLTSSRVPCSFLPLSKEYGDVCSVLIFFPQKDLCKIIKSEQIITFLNKNK